MDYSEFEAFVRQKESQLDINEPETFEVAFLKIYIKFQTFIGELFLNYSLGLPSEEGYCPNRLLLFVDEKQLRDFFRKNGKRYVDLYELAMNQGGFFFSDNPFDVMTESSNFNQVLKQMAATRNYLVHDSLEAKEKFLNTCLNGKPTTFDIGRFLMSLYKENGRAKFSFYTLFQKTMLDIADAVRRKSLL